MAAIPVSSNEMATSTPQPRGADQIADLERRLTILERALLANHEERLAAIELFLFGP
jgi:hypothetical protein